MIDQMYCKRQPNMGGWQAEKAPHPIFPPLKAGGADSRKEHAGPPAVILSKSVLDLGTIVPFIPGWASVGCEVQSARFFAGTALEPAFIY